MTPNIPYITPKQYLLQFRKVMHK